MKRIFSRLVQFMLLVTLVSILLPSKAEAAATSGSCGSGVNWSYSGGTLTISGSGQMKDYPVYDTPASDQCMPWYAYKDSITTVNIGEGVTKVGACSFWGCSNLQNISFPNSLKEIGFAAFADCKKIGSVNIPSGKIGESAFIRCSAMTKATFGPNVTAMGVSAFENCTGLQGVYISDVAAWCKIDFGGYLANPLRYATHLYLNNALVTDLSIPNGVAEIRDYAFWYCADLKTVTIPSSVASVSDYAFYMCTALNKVVMSEGVKKIGASAFDSCSSLNQVTIPASVSYIGSYGFAYTPIPTAKVMQGEIAAHAFQNCGGLYDVTLGDKITRIGDFAFDQCAALKTGMGVVTYTGSQVQWDSIRKGKNNDCLINATKRVCTGTGTEKVNPTADYPTMTFGSYEQDNNTGNGKEPLEWYVVKNESGKKMLVSKYVIDFQQYYPNLQTTVTWSNSSLRTWLNSTFKNEAFTNSDKSKLVVTSVSPKNNPVYGVAGGGATKDSVFILSDAEASSLFPAEDDRQAACTAFALARSGDSALRNPTLGTSYWWVNTPGINYYSAMYVHYTGSLRYDGMAVANTICGVRPVIWIDENAADRPMADEGLVGQFVARLYNVCLNREPDDAGKADWVNRLVSGTESGANVAYGFVFSQEFKNYNYCNTDYVKLLYRAFMGREADDAGLNDWVSRLESGVTREEVFNGFSQSLEFKNLCQQYGITVGSGVAIPKFGTVPAGACAACGAVDGVTGFVIRLYNTCLDRDPDQGGLRDWTTQLRQHTKTGRDVSFGFIFSQEFINKGLSDEVFVEYLYRALFDRPADDAGKNDWLNRMHNEGYDRQQVFNGFMGSEEFNNLCKKYGIVRE